MTARSVRLLPFALATLAIALAAPAQSGTSQAPEVVDAPGDAKLPQLDIASAWFDANDTHLLVHIERGAESGSPPAIVACQAGQCVGAGVSLRVVYSVLKPDGTPAPQLTNYSSSYVLVRLGPNDPNVTAAAGFYDAAGTATLVDAATVTVEGVSVTVAVPRSAKTLAIPDGAKPGAYRIASPYALSYVMPCSANSGQGAPTDGCLNIGAANEAVASGWDRAPDAGNGTDYVFPTPPPPAPVAKPKATTSAGSTTTVTVVQKEVQTRTVTHTVTYMPTPFPLVSDSQGAPGLGLVAILGVLGVALLLRRGLR